MTAAINHKVGTEQVHNPFLDEFRQIKRGFGDSGQRSALCEKYAWAIPDDEAIRAIQKEGPIVEIGAGSGYWAYLLRQVGVEIVAYDAKPGHNHWCGHDPWTEVLVGGPDKVRQHPHHTLMLCWPPYNDPMGADCLKAFTGTTVIHIGEGSYGCTGDSEYHEMLSDQFKEGPTVYIPTWFSVNDALHVWYRK